MGRRGFCLPSFCGADVCDRRFELRRWSGRSVAAYMLPEVREGLAGSAGGVVSTVSLGLTFLIPVALSFCIGESYETLLFGCAVLFGATALVSPFLPSPDSLM